MSESMKRSATDAEPGGRKRRALRKQLRLGIDEQMCDGLYQVTTSYLCAGFIMREGKVVACAPSLREKIEYWQTVARRVCD